MVRCRHCSVGSEAALSIVHGLSLCCDTCSLHRGEFILAPLTNHLLWSKTVPPCLSLCMHQLCEAALLSQLHLKIKSYVVHLLSGVSPATKLTKLLTLRRFLPFQPSPLTLPSHQPAKVITEHNYFCM